MTAREEVREHLAHEVAHASHLLPSQGPIGTFIHHNTLHGLQHLPFHDALAEGQRLLGGRGYLPTETFRGHHATGRISDDDIDAALDDAGADAETEPIARGLRDITVRQVRRAHLVHGVEPLDPSSLAFRHDEEGALRRLRPDVPAAAREAILAAAAAELEAGLDAVGRTNGVADWLLAHTGVDVPAWVREEVARSPEDPSELRDARRLRAEARALEILAPRHFGVRGGLDAVARELRRDLEAYAVASLWRACLAAYGLQDPLSPSDPRTLVARDPRAGAEALGSALREVEGSDAPPSPAMIEAAATEAELAIAGVARDGTHAALLRELCGEDVAERVDVLLIKRCAAFLDEGQAAWRLPHRDRGFYGSWRALTATDRSLDLDEAPGWRERLAQLPERPDDAVIAFLEELGVPPEEWGGYCRRLLVRLPGWAGLISWRESRPAYPRQQAQPIALVDLLAVRLFYETALLRGLSLRTWGIEPSVAALREHFRAQPFELVVRRALQRGELPDGLAERARARAFRDRRRPQLGGARPDGLAGAPGWRGRCGPEPWSVAPVPARATPWPERRDGPVAAT